MTLICCLRVVQSKFICKFQCWCSRSCDNFFVNRDVVICDVHIHDIRHEYAQINIRSSHQCIVVFVEHAKTNVFATFVSREFEFTDCNLWFLCHALFLWYWNDNLDQSFVWFRWFNDKALKLKFFNFRDSRSNRFLNNVFLFFVSFSFWFDDDLFTFYSCHLTLRVIIYSCQIKLTYDFNLISICHRSDDLMIKRKN